MSYKYRALFLILFLITIFSLQVIDAKTKQVENLKGKIITIDPGHGCSSYTLV